MKCPLCRKEGEFIRLGVSDGMTEAGRVDVEFWHRGADGRGPGSVCVTALMNHEEAARAFALPDGCERAGGWI